VPGRLTAEIDFGPSDIFASTLSFLADQLVPPIALTRAPFVSARTFAAAPSPSEAHFWPHRPPLGGATLFQNLPKLYLEVSDFLILASDNFQLILGLMDRDPRLRFEVPVMQPCYR
jgi:hypothetical protein